MIRRSSYQRHERLSTSRTSQLVRKIRSQNESRELGKIVLWAILSSLSMLPPSFCRTAAKSADVQTTGAAASAVPIAAVAWAPPTDSSLKINLVVTILQTSCCTGTLGNCWRTAASPTGYNTMEAVASAGGHNPSNITLHGTPLNCWRTAASPMVETRLQPLFSPPILVQHLRGMFHQQDAGQAARRCPVDPVDPVSRCLDNRCCTCVVHEDCLFWTQCVCKSCACLRAGAWYCILFDAHHLSWLAAS